MNNLEYLNEISKQNRPVKQPFFSLQNPIVKVLLIGLGALILILVVGSILKSGSGPSSNSLLGQLNLRSDNLSQIITTYSPKLKSSDLRAISSTLQSTLKSNTTQLQSYAASAGILTSVTSAQSATESNLYTDLDSTLADAKLSGILDRIYLNQIQLQVSLLLGLISETATASAKSPGLLTILASYSDNLDLIYTSLKNYSNPGT